MRAARLREHKLAVRRYLTSSDGANLRKAVAEQMSISNAKLIELLDSLPPLEMYLPVRQHRGAWAGGAELTVAAGLHEGEAPRGFALDGSSVTLSETAPPSRPVLILTKVETDFNKTIDDAMWTNVEDADGAAIGTFVRRSEVQRSGSQDVRKSSLTNSNSRGGLASMVVTIPPCDPCTDCDPCLPPPPPPQRGPDLWIDNIHFDDYEEPWYRGEAEITVLMSGPGINGFEGAKLPCGGQYANTQAQHDAAQKYFDQSGHDWSRDPYLFEGLLFGQADLNEFGTIYQSNVPASIGPVSAHLNGH